MLKSQWACYPDHIVQMGHNLQWKSYCIKNTDSSSTGMGTKMYRIQFSKKLEDNQQYRIICKSDKTY